MRGVAWLLALSLFLTYAYFVSPPSWNENSRFNLVRSLVERQRLDIDPYHQITGDKAFRDGHHYSDKAPGSALVAVPAYAVYYGFLRVKGADPPAAFPDADMDPGKRAPKGDGPRYQVNASFRRALYVCNVFTNAIAGALLGALFFLVAARTAPPRLALAATGALALGSLVFPYATMFYGHVLAAFFLFAGFAAASARRLLWAGALAGMAVLTELPCAVPALALAGYVVLAARDEGEAWRAALRRGGRFVLGMIGPVLVLVAYQQAAFGNPWRPGYAQVSDPLFAEGMAEGVMGVGLPRPAVLAAILVGRARGLLYLAPVLALALVGLGVWVRRAWRARPGRAEALLAAFVVLYFLLFNAGYYMWYGGSALGPRHLIPALPFLCLGLLHPAVASARGRRVWGVLVLVLLVPSVANHLAATATEPAAPLVRDVLRDHVYRHLLRGEVPAVSGASTLAAGLGLRGVVSLVPLLVVWALGVRMMLQHLPGRSAGGNIAPPGAGVSHGSESGP